MKKIVSNKELKEKMKIAVNLLCDTVKTTFGPQGNNIIIDHSTFSPFITNDGATIAMNIQSEDEVINTILEIAKESSLITNEKVGDGTTSTLVLLQSIFNNGLNLIENNKNPVTLKKELDENINFMIEYIKSKSFKPKHKDITNIAIISSKSKELGKLISNAYFKVKNINAISIKEQNDRDIKVNIQKGYSIETIIASEYFFKDKNKINIDELNILIVNNCLDDIEEISNIIDYIVVNEYPLLIICEEYSQSFVNQILNLFLNEEIKIYLLKTPEYGKNKIDTMNDLALISNAKIVEDKNYISETKLGKVKSVEINKEKTIFKITENKKVKEKINELKKIKEIKEINDIDMNFINKRISMLKNGLVEILVGAPTETERREKIMRCEDALNAIDSALKGVIPGSGIVLYELSEILPVINESSNILIRSLKEPFNQIIYNSGKNSDEIINKIKKENYNIIYNITKNSYEDIINTEVIDSSSVIINSLINAISIAGMLLTTTSLIINEYVNNICNNNAFNEL